MKNSLQVPLGNTIQLTLVSLFVIGARVICCLLKVNSTLGLLPIRILNGPSPFRFIEDPGVTSLYSNKEILSWISIQLSPIKFNSSEWVIFSSVKSCSVSLEGWELGFSDLFSGVRFPISGKSSGKLLLVSIIPSANNSSSEALLSRDLS